MPARTISRSGSRVPQTGSGDLVIGLMSTKWRCTGFPNQCQPSWGSGWGRGKCKRGHLTSQHCPRAIDGAMGRESQRRARSNRVGVSRSSALISAHPATQRLPRCAESALRTASKPSADHRTTVGVYAPRVNPRDRDDRSRATVASGAPCAAGGLRAFVPSRLEVSRGQPAPHRILPAPHPSG